MVNGRRMMWEMKMQRRMGVSDICHEVYTDKKDLKGFLSKGVM